MFKRALTIIGIGALLAAATSFGGPGASAAGSNVESKIFTNGDGDANDLHIFFFDEVKVLEIRGCGPAFAVMRVNAAGNRVTLKKAAHNIPSGRPVVCTFVFDANGGGGIDHWYWTKDGVQVGSTHGGCDTPGCDEYLS